jgi:hypothetical protein
MKSLFTFLLLLANYYSFCQWCTKPAINNAIVPITLIRIIFKCAVMEAAALLFPGLITGLNPVIPFSASG